MIKFLKVIQQNKFKCKNYTNQNVHITIMLYNSGYNSLSYLAIYGLMNSTIPAFVLLGNLCCIANKNIKQY